MAGDLPLSRPELESLFDRIRTIAVVGASEDEAKKAHHIPAYLQSRGYRIIPVNPRAEEIFGVPAVGSLSDIDEPVDAVDVFRPAAEAPDIARQAAAIGAEVLWLQLGIVSDEAERIGREAGMTVVMDACMGAVHKKIDRLRESDG